MSKKITIAQAVHAVYSGGGSIIRQGHYNIDRETAVELFQISVERNASAFEHYDHLVWALWSISKDDPNEVVDVERIRRAMAFFAGTSISRHFSYTQLNDFIQQYLDAEDAESVRLKTYTHRRTVASRHTYRRTVRHRILKRDKHRCVLCGCRDDLTIDHIIPVKKGGGNEDKNLQTLCRKCNSSKGAR